MDFYTFYKIVCKDKNIKSCYVGSSKSFTNRKLEHKSTCNNEDCRAYNFKLYQFIRENCGFDNFEFVVIQEKKCDREEALWIERKYIEDLGADLNTNIPIITKEERFEYYEKNKDKYKEQQKIYRENNKDKIKEQQKIYRENNKDKIKEKKKEKITCECGSIICRDKLTRHNKSKKHRMFIELKQWRETIYETIYQENHK